MLNYTERGYLCFFLIRQCDALVGDKCQQRLQNKDTTHAQMLKTVLPVSGIPSLQHNYMSGHVHVY
jgi:hypothetical protein